MLGAYRTGVAGQAGITLVSLAYAPNAAVWAAAYLLGPGFAVGVDTTVRTTEVTVGALPAVPAGRRHPARPGRRPRRGAARACRWWPGWSPAGCSPAGCCGAGERRSAGAACSARRRSPGRSPGALLGAAAVASSGALGGGRLATIGPVAWQVAAVATVVVAVGAVVGAAATRALAGP